MAIIDQSVYDKLANAKTVFKAQRYGEGVRTGLCDVDDALAEALQDADEAIAAEIRRGFVKIEADDSLTSTTEGARASAAGIAAARSSFHAIIAQVGIEQGGIDTSDANKGKDTSSDSDYYPKRLRTIGYISPNVGEVRFMCPAGIRPLYSFYYSKGNNDVYTCQGYGQWSYSQDRIDYTLNKNISSEYEGCYIRLVFAKVNLDDAITPDELKIGDGDEKRNAEINFQDLIEQVGIEQGALATASGEKAASDSRVRTSGFIKPIDIKLRLPTGIRPLYSFYYNATTLAFDSYGTWLADGREIYDLQLTKNHSNHLTKIVFVKGDGTEKITPDDLRLSKSWDSNDRITINGLVLEQGAITISGGKVTSGSIGENTNSSKRVRTAGTIDHSLSITCPYGIVVFAVVVYDTNGAFYSVAKPHTRFYNHVHRDGYVVRFVFSKYDDENDDLSPNEMKTTTMIDDRIIALERPKLIPYAKFDLDSGEESVVHDAEIQSIFNEEEVNISSYYTGTGIPLKTTAKDAYNAFNGAKVDNYIREMVYASFDTLLPETAGENDYVTKIDGLDFFKSTKHSPLYFNSDYPDYIQRLGGDWGIYVYKFGKATTNVNTITTEDENHNVIKKESSLNPRKKLLLIGGTHGREVTAPYNLYLFARRLCESDDLNFVKLRNTFDIYIVPCLCGLGMRKNLYHNGDDSHNYEGIACPGVNINRNYENPKNYKYWTEDGEFKKAWASFGNYSASKLEQYGGPEAMSEFENRLIANIINSVKPDGVIDHHDSGDDNWVFYTTIAGQEKMLQAYQSLIDVSRALKTAYPNYFNDGNELLNLSDGSNPRTSSGIHVAASTDNYAFYHGVPISATMEVMGSIEYGGTKYVNYSSDDAYQIFACSEAQLRPQIFRMCQWIMDHVDAKGNVIN